MGVLFIAVSQAIVRGVQAKMASACFSPASNQEELERGMSYANVTEQLMLRTKENITFNSSMPVSLMLQCCDAHDMADLRRAVLVCLCFADSVQTMDTPAIKLLNMIISDNQEQEVARFLLVRASYWMGKEPAVTRCAPTSARRPALHTVHLRDRNGGLQLLS
jgi:hypothetical protein